SFNFQSKKEDGETKVGNAMNLEGGVGGDFRQGRVTAGLVYYTSLKLSQDRIDGIPSILIRGKNKVFAFGPEVSIAIESKGTIYGFCESELSVGDLRQDEYAGQRADNPGIIPLEADQVAVAAPIADVE